MPDQMVREPRVTIAPAPVGASSLLPSVAILLFLLVLWGRLFWGLTSEWELDPQYAHGWFVPILGGILLLGRWRDRPEVETSRHRPILFVASLLLLLPLLPLKFLGVVFPEARPFHWMHAAIVVAITFSAIWSLGGLRWLRHFSFPILFMLVAVPWGRAFQNDVTNRLMHWAASISVELVLLAGIPAMQDGNTIALTGQVVGVDEACSGIRSLQGSIMAGLFLGEFYRLGAFSRTVLLSAAVGFSLLLNVLRAAVLTWVCATSGAAGLQKFHDPAGLAILVVVFLLSIGLANLLARGGDEEFKSEVIAQPKLHPVFSRFAAGLCAAGLVWLGAVEIGAAAYFRGTQSAGDQAAWDIDYTRMQGPIEDQAISETARQYLRFDSGQAKAIDLPTGELIRVIDLKWKGGEISRAGARAHSPAICLPALGYEPKGSIAPLSVAVRNMRGNFNVDEFNKNGRTAFVYHGLWEAGAPATFEQVGDQSLGSAISAVKARRILSDSRVLLIMIVGPEEINGANEVLKKFLDTVVVERPGSGGGDSALTPS